MSLNYDLGKVKDYKTKCFINKGEERCLHPLTYVLIWVMMPIGVGEITEKNLDKVYKRIYAYERLFGKMLQGPNSGFLTYQNVQDHIGLRINGLDLADSVIKKNWMETLWRDKMHEASGMIIKAVTGKA